MTAFPFVFYLMDAGVQKVFKKFFSCALLALWIGDLSGSEEIKKRSERFVMYDDCMIPYDSDGDDGEWREIENEKGGKVSLAWAVRYQ